MEAMNLEELTDCLLLLQKFGATRTRSVGIVGGLADGGGGISVSGSDACADNGLDVPELEPAIAAGLRELIGEVGSILRNPVDVSPAQFRGMDVLFESIRLVASDPGVELLIVQEDVDIMLSYLGDSETDSINHFLSTLQDECHKPLVMVMPPGSCEAKRLESVERMQEAGVPVFPTMSRAARAISIVSHRPTAFTNTPPLQ
jgi:acyl-CoA synthetase (NDP forming)